MFKKFKKNKDKNKTEEHGRGILVFENTTEVIKAEKILKASGWKIKVMGPPPNIRTGCDLVIEFPLIEELAIVRILKDVKVEPLQVVPVNEELLEPVNLLHEKEFGKYLMIRAANMKVTVDRETNIIVNISGGGCPDVPYLAEQMVNKKLDEVEEPREIGHTLCAYALQIAYDRMVEIC